MCNTHTEYYQPAIDQHPVGLKLVLGGTGLGKTSNFALPYILAHSLLSRITFDCLYNIWRIEATIRQAWFLSQKTMLNLILAQHGTNEFYGI